MNPDRFFRPRRSTFLRLQRIHRSFLRSRSTAIVRSVRFLPTNFIFHILFFQFRILLKPSRPFERVRRSICNNKVRRGRNEVFIFVPFPISAMLTSDTTTLTTQQLTGLIHPPPIVSATILNSTMPTENGRTVDPTLSLSLNQIAEKVQRHRRSSRLNSDAVFR